MTQSAPNASRAAALAVVSVMRDVSRPVLCERWDANGDDLAAPGAPIPEGYWVENACLPLRSSDTGAWALPLVYADEVIFGLSAAAYAKLDYVAERPLQYVSFADAEPAHAHAAAWAHEPHVELLSAARREIGCWCTVAADVADALRTLWPELELGFSLIPGRPRDRLPTWRPAFGMVSPSSATGA